MNPTSTLRLSVVLEPDVDPGSAVNAAAIVTAGLRCDAFTEPIVAADGVRHAAVHWNVVILKAKTRGQLRQLIDTCPTAGVEFVVFTGAGRSLSNDFDAYAANIEASATDRGDVLAVAIYGDEDTVKGLTRPFSVYRPAVP